MIEVTCMEPIRGRNRAKMRPREVRHVIAPLLFTSERLAKFYSQASKFPVLFGYEIPTPSQFADIFLTFSVPSGDPILNGLFWSVDDLDTGILYLTDITPTEATAHFAFFDRIMEGRERLVLALMTHVFTEFGFNRLNVEIPVYVRHVHTFAKRLGCKQEGVKRDACFYKGAWFDANLYGILKSEILPQSESNDGHAD